MSAAREFRTTAPASPCPLSGLERIAVTTTVLRLVIYTDQSDVLARIVMIPEATREQGRIAARSMRDDNGWKVRLACEAITTTTIEFAPGQDVERFHDDMAAGVFDEKMTELAQVAA